MALLMSLLSSWDNFVSMINITGIDSKDGQKRCNTIDKIQAHIKMESAHWKPQTSQSITPGAFNFTCNFKGPSKSNQINNGLINQAPSVIIITKRDIGTVSAEND